MDVHSLALDGLLEYRPARNDDRRGQFAKTFQYSAFASLGLHTDWREEFYSISARDVVRGMHFQCPPADQLKFVYCVVGCALDVVLDMRRGSPTYGRHATIELRGFCRSALYIPRGFAHGFLALTADTVMAYKVSSEYSPSQDHGVHWNSFGFMWPVEAPIVSERDAALPAWTEFDSPFQYSNA